ncbi:MAG TPA: J domain-containing protein [Ilumatobacteraceae bacterium]|jgi:hypothetical protein|uniref:J domain-containing protein n=1 Tax=Gordonia sp. UBA5067 TaxID=1946575 RepID=UPI000ECB9FE5|nr:J domain-containing protein [Gordonia sp. UBA5067]MBK9969361.1 J domain-containing protein [Acidimicrobiaceae bacterium]HAN36525.1 hypothetical protein [Acidimicrobiaceae bacterium]HQZ36914.1 J domain-containing protein [Ilumatobacteraceae bacterium]HRC08831.1 J domain-containing protein [Miltoncostaeales bacterium]
MRRDSELHDGSHVVTPYDTLGVARDASDTELRSAYRTRARQLHPDLRRDRTPTERADDERAMQCLNAAWHVLREPDRRHRYDQSLDELRADGHHVEPATDNPPAHVDEPTGPARVRPIMALLGALLACTIGTAFVLLHETSSQTPSEGVGAVTAGDCVTVRGGHISEIVPCDSPNDGQVMSEIPRSQTCATTQRLVDGRIGGSTFFCLDTTGRP